MEATKAIFNLGMWVAQALLSVSPSLTDRVKLAGFTHDVHGQGVLLYIDDTEFCGIFPDIRLPEFHGLTHHMQHHTGNNGEKIGVITVHGGHVPGIPCISHGYFILYASGGHAFVSTRAEPRHNNESGQLRGYDYLPAHENAAMRIAAKHRLSASEAASEAL